MARIKTALTAKSGESDANAAEWRRLIDELNLRRRAAAEGGSTKARERHVARGKLLARERVEHVWRAVEGLSERQRTVFLLRFVEELELSEIAHSTGLSEGTVKAHLSRALARVRTELGGQR